MPRPFSLARGAGGFFVWALSTAGIFVDLSEAWSAPPTLSHIFPAGGQRGFKTVVTCTGNFAWPAKVWAPGIDVVPTKESGKLEVSIPKDLAADRVWIRLYNAEGISAPAPFLIGNLKEINEQEPNDRIRNAQAIADPHVTVNGVLKNGDVDGFLVNLTAGQTLVAAVDAYSLLGSPMDAILQVVSTDGVVLAENHDDVQLDPRLAFTVTKAGAYIVRLFAFPAGPDTSIRFSGGDNYIYRLTLTTGPFVTHTVPLSAPLSNPGIVEVFGWNIPAKTKLPVTPFGGPRLADYQEFEVLDEMRISPDSRLGFVFASQFAGSARVRLIPHAAVEVLAQTDPKKPMTLTPATSVTGCLRTSRQTDEFRVPLKKGQQVIVSVEARNLDFPLDPVVKMVDPGGAVIADIDDTGTTRDAAFAHVATKDGIYRLFVGDRYRQGGDRCFYRLTVRWDEPDFELFVNTDAIVVTPNKPTELPIKVQRRAIPAGSVGPITIQVIGLPSTVTTAALVSEPTGPTAETVTLKFSTSGPPFSGPFRIVGQATLPKGGRRFVRTAPKLRATFETIWLTAVEKK